MRVEEGPGRNFAFQGMALVSLGLFLMGLGLFGQNAAEILVVGAPLAVAFALMSSLYFGRRRGPSRVATPWSPLARVVGFLLLCGVFAAVVWAHVRLGAGWTPVSPETVAVALAFGMAAHPDWRRRSHFVLVAALLALVGLVPLGLWTASGVHPLTLDATGDLLLVMGAALCVAGLLDHLALKREYGRVGGAGAE